MKVIDFSISSEELLRLTALYPNIKKNSDIGKFAVDVAQLYFLHINQSAQFIKNKGGIDLSVNIEGSIENYEIKGTNDKNISWNKIKVSSKRCYEYLVNGMTLLRITNIGSKDMRIYFLKYGEDFNLIEEPRWSVVKSYPSKL